MRCVVPAVDSAAGHAPAARLVPILSLTPQYAAVGRSVPRAGRGASSTGSQHPKGPTCGFGNQTCAGGKHAPAGGGLRCYAA